MKKPSKQTLALLRINRDSFTKSGAFLRQTRQEVIALCYDDLTDLSVPAKTRNQRLLELVRIAAEDGLYAPPANFDIDKHGSHADIRWSIGRLLWREWIKRENKRLEAKGSKKVIPPCDWREWSPWCARNGWSLSGRWFITPAQK